MGHYMLNRWGPCDHIIEYIGDIGNIHKKHSQWSGDPFNPSIRREK